MSKEIYNEFYKTHGTDIHADPNRFLTIANLCKGRVLDVGCGTGDLSDFYKGEYEGIDISNVAIELAREKKCQENCEGKDVEIQKESFKVLDITKPITDTQKKFDTIVLGEFLEHLKDDEIVFQNIKKIAKDNARIIITVPNGNRVPDENHFREFTVPELRKKFCNLGKVKFHNWTGFKNRILMTIDLQEKNEDLVSLVMIVSNEQLGLERAILSVIDFVDQIVISVDNNSQDETLLIAERYADIVKCHAWENDFAKARNFAQEGVNSKWILCLDGHEYVESYKRLDEMLKSNDDGLAVKVKMEGGDTFISPRFYKSHIKWEHAIHNAINCKTMRKFTEFIIVHDRKGGQSKKSADKRRKQVDEMMEKELKKELKTKKFKSRALFYLARYYRYAKQYRKALRYYKKYLKNGRAKGEKWLVAYEAGILANSMGKFLTALKFFRKAEEILPNRWEISLQIGLTYMCFNHWEKATEFLVDSFKINEGEFSYNPEQRNDGKTWGHIGFCFFQMKEYTKAKIAWEEAIKNSDNKIDNELNKKRIELIDRGLLF